MGCNQKQGCLLLSLPKKFQETQKVGEDKTTQGTGTWRINITSILLRWHRNGGSNLLVKMFHPFLELFIVQPLETHQDAILIGVVPLQHLLFCESSFLVTPCLSTRERIRRKESENEENGKKRERKKRSEKEQRQERIQRMKRESKLKNEKQKKCGIGYL